MRAKCRNQTWNRCELVRSNPEVLGSRGNNKFNYTFYNSDVTHRIRLILEGYNDEGKLIHLEKLIE